MARTRDLILAGLLVVAPGTGLAGELNCPKGTSPNGERTPDASEEWCETMRGGRVMLHGPYRAWWPNGQLGTEGQYRYDKAVGTWKGWYPYGKPAGEELFERGRLTQGRYWDQRGNPISEPAEQPNKPLERPGMNTSRRSEGASAVRSAPSRSPDRGRLIGERDCH